MILLYAILISAVVFIAAALLGNQIVDYVSDKINKL